MKKVIFMVVMLSLVATGTAFAGISGTAHDLSQEAYATTDNQLCVFCHTPHNSDTSITVAPLWNHNVDGTTTYTPYSTGTINATIPTTLTGISALCMGCHDGTIAIDSFGNNAGSYPGGTTTMPSANGALLDTDLRDDHPVGFVYNTTLATTDGELNDPTALSNASVVLFGTVAATKTVECATCHDVHDDTNGNFLVMSNTGSALCLVCHDK